MKRVTPKIAMSSREFETALQTFFPEIGPIAALSKMLHRNRRTVRRWRSDPSLIPPEAVMLIRAMGRHGLDMTHIEALAKYRSDA